MKTKTALALLFMSLMMVFHTNSVYAFQDDKPAFDLKKDLLLVNFDCKTDVDDLHTIAGLATLLEVPQFSKLHFHAVTGTYGIQKGLYVPPNPLMKLAFGNNWTDAHEKMELAVGRVKKTVLKTIKKKGVIWIAEAGQSDFSAKLIQAIQEEMPKIVIKEHFHIIQHSEWNENKTTPEFLDFVKNNSDYQKIPDGNDVGNGSPGFKSLEYKKWEDKIKNPKLIAIWKLATELATQYNAKDGRYNNKAVKAGSLDFSDLSEVCWILGLNDVKDIEDFFNRFGQ